MCIDFRHLIPICCGILVLAFVGGCATLPSKPSEVKESKPEPSKVEAPLIERRFPEFIAVIAQEGDTFSSFAAKYLNDPSMDWFIAEYNDIDSLKPGQALIIPLKPYEKGGLTSKGYQTVPVLSYHNFSLEKSTSRMTVTKAAFEEQMKLLRDKGYRVISMDQLFDFLEFKSQIPKKSVVITIDDGWRSAYDIALPILKEYGYPATFFVYTDLIVGSHKTLSWELVKELAKNGIDVQGHTKTHRDLTLVDKKESFTEYFEAIKKELSESARVIKAKVGKDIKYLSYPNGETNHLVIELVKKCGYRGAFTIRREGNPFFIHDYRVNRSMIYGDFDLNQFEKNLNVFTEEPLK
jgi:peptidoglycan/xylan/chitin deacetylase (PgdA/CDA1 family)